MINETKRKDIPKNKIFIALLFGAIISSYLQTALSMALPSIMNDFSISAATGQWLMSIYTLAMGIMIPVSPFLLRRYKTKTVALSVVGVMIIGVLIATVATSFTVLLIGRIIQGLATGVILSLVQVVILTIYPANKRGSMMGIFGLAAAAAPVVAPTIAGILTDLFSWRAIFIVALVGAIINFIFLLIVMQNVLSNEVQSFDILSMIFCAIGFTGIIVGCGNIGSYKWMNVNVTLPIIVGITALILFTRRQIKMDKAFLELKVFKNRDFTVAVIMCMLTFFALIASSTIFPIYLQIVHGLTATVSGLIMMPGSFVSAFLNPFAGKIYDRFGIRQLAITGSILFVLSYLFTTFLTETSPVAMIVVIFILQTIAIACVMMPLITWGMSSLDKQSISDGTAIINMLRTIAGAIGAALIMAVMSNVTKSTSKIPDVIANISGIRMAYVSLFILASVQLMIAVVFVGKQGKLKVIEEVESVRE